jgi:hypothetical protein
MSVLASKKPSAPEPFERAFAQKREARETRVPPAVLVMGARLLLQCARLGLVHYPLRTKPPNSPRLERERRSGATPWCKPCAASPCLQLQDDAAATRRSLPLRAPSIPLWRPIGSRASSDTAARASLFAGAWGRRHTVSAVTSLLSTQDVVVPSSCPLDKPECSLLDGR